MSKKSSFILYHDILEEILDLSDRDAGRLIKAIYYFSAEGVESKDDVPPKARTLYSVIIKHIKRDTEKYEQRCEKNRINGSKGGIARKQSLRKSSECLNWLAKVADNDNENDNENDNDNVNESENDNERQTQIAPDANFPHPRTLENNIF